MSAVLDYFNQKSGQYDDTDKQSYWRFSDELLWDLLSRFVLPKNRRESFSFLDAGGGTGRWSFRIFEAYPEAGGSVVDLSDGMLGVARSKFKRYGFENRARCILDDVCRMDRVPEDEFDLAICFHNVIGFVSDYRKAIERISNKLKTGGKIALMAPSYYHALYFCNANNRHDELKRIIEERHVCYNDQMPPLRVFEIPEVIDLLSEAGFAAATPYGFPTTFYPGMNETFLQGESEDIVDLLGQSTTDLLEIEKALCAQPHLASRGNNILYCAEKI